MASDDLDNLIAQARTAQERLDLSAAEYAFETRLGARLADLPRGPGPLERMHLWWRSAAVVAAAVGVVVAFFFLAGRGQAELDDTLAAWWTGGATTWNDSLFN